MASSNCKKRKYEDEKRNFKPEWEEDFAFTVKGGKPKDFENIWYIYMCVLVITESSTN